MHVPDLLEIKWWLCLNWWFLDLYGEGIVVVMGVRLRFSKFQEVLHVLSVFVYWSIEFLFVGEFSYANVMSSFFKVWFSVLLINDWIGTYCFLIFIRDDDLFISCDVIGLLTLRVLIEFYVEGLLMLSLFKGILDCAWLTWLLLLVMTGGLLRMVGLFKGMLWSRNCLEVWRRISDIYFLSDFSSILFFYIPVFLNCPRNVLAWALGWGPYKFILWPKNLSMVLISGTSFVKLSPSSIKLLTLITCSVFADFYYCKGLLEQCSWLLDLSDIECLKNNIKVWITLYFGYINNL